MKKLFGLTDVVKEAYICTSKKKKKSYHNQEANMYRKLYSYNHTLV